MVKHNDKHNNNDDGNTISRNVTKSARISGSKVSIWSIKFYVGRYKKLDNVINKRDILFIYKLAKSPPLYDLVSVKNPSEQERGFLQRLKQVRNKRKTQELTLVHV